MLEGCEVGSSVIKATIALANQSGAAFELGDVFEKDNHGAFAFPGDAFLLQLIYQLLQMGIVEAFPERVVELDAKPPINRVELSLGQGNHFAPDAQIFLVPALKVD